MSQWIGFGVGLILGFYIGVFVMVAVRMSNDVIQGPRSGPAGMEG